ncbi:hypothetical protein KUDE01_010150 [Dissostichus eleginoides]|uniref:Uncharacterized protein n=1 Tax=Dissostichus eleginoides TaxID=100907 RepID=A0AAD9F6Y6_DISEL|nr:hypothetical protein KUDE01_010150 [Dissostichus eleginoides]
MKRARDTKFQDAKVFLTSGPKQRLLSLLFPRLYTLIPGIKSFQCHPGEDFRCSRVSLELNPARYQPVSGVFSGCF